MDFKRCLDKSCIYDLLVSFENIFPHLTEKISSFDDYAQKLSEYAYVVEAREENESAGILVFYANDQKTKTAYISLIGVKKEKSRKGIGKALLNYCEEFSLKQGMSRLRLEVDKDNVNAIRFYEKNGFSCEGEASQDSFYMIKDF